MGLAFKPSVSTLKKTNYISFPFGHTNQVQLGKEPVRWLHFGCLCAGLEASTWPNPLPNDAQKRNCMHHCAATVVGTCKSRKNSSSIPSSNSTKFSLGTAVTGCIWLGALVELVLVSGNCSRTHSLEIWETWVVQSRGQLWLIMPSILGGDGC